MVTLLVPFDGWAGPMQTVSGSRGGDLAECGGADGEQCLRDILAEYEANTDALLAELTAIVDPAETPVRVLDSYLVHIGDLDRGGALETVAAYWLESQAFVAETAASYGIPVAGLLEAFTGPDGTENPMAKGLVLADQEHPTESGADLITDLVADLGFALSE